MKSWLKMYLRYVASIHKYARNRRTYLGSTYEGIWQRELQVPFLLYALCFSNLFPSILFESDQTILHVLLLCSWMFQIFVGSGLSLALLCRLPIYVAVLFDADKFCAFPFFFVLETVVVTSRSKNVLSDPLWNMSHIRILQTWNIWFYVFRILWDRQCMYIRPMII